MEQTLSAPFLDRERDVRVSYLDRERDMYASCAKSCALDLEKE